MCAAATFEDGLRPSLNLATLKHKVTQVNTLPPGGTLSPDIRSPTFVPNFTSTVETTTPSAERIGNYLLLEKLTTTGAVETYKAIHIALQEEYVCKVFPLNKYRDILSPYWQSGSHPHIADIVEILLGSTRAYVIFKNSFEDLHSYIRKKRRLREPEAAQLFAQIISAIKHCHKRGIVLRDLKLRKFVFVDQQRNYLVLDSLEDAVLLEDTSDDRLTDKHGCPAYVSPEILSSHGYSGRSADMWSLGVILYTMLFGQYPFHDTVASQLFGKIRRGHYTIPDSVSTQARCLVRSLLRTDPTERLSILEAAKHPWFDTCHSNPVLQVPNVTALSRSTTRDPEQRVPDIDQMQLKNNPFVIEFK